MTAPADRTLHPALARYVLAVEAVSRRVGRVAMYLVVAMLGILLWSSISKTFLLPSLWTLEMAQFTMVAYYMLGGAYSLQMGEHVRMDLFHSRWSERRRLQMDVLTVLFLIVYLGFLLWGGWSSTSYALEYGERSATAWRPYLAPIKILMCFGVFLMLLQATALLIRDVAKLRGEEIR